MVNLRKHEPYDEMSFCDWNITEVLFLSIILCLANTGIVNVLVSTLYSKPDEVTGYECSMIINLLSCQSVALSMIINLLSCQSVAFKLKSY